MIYNYSMKVIVYYEYIIIFNCKENQLLIWMKVNNLSKELNLIIIFFV